MLGRSATRRTKSSAAWKAMPQARPSSAQSVAANRRVRPGARKAMTASGRSLRLSSMTAAIATIGPAEPTGNPMSAARCRHRNAMASAHTADREKKPEGRPPANRLGGRQGQPAHQDEGTGDPDMQAAAEALDEH